MIRCPAVQITGTSKLNNPSTPLMIKVDIVGFNSFCSFSGISPAVITVHSRANSEIFF